MSLSDLPAPSDVSEVQDLEQDLEQALDGGGYFPVEETGLVQSVADSEEHEEEPSPTFSSEEPTTHPRYPSSTAHASTDRAESQSPQALTVEQSSPAPSVMFTPTPAFPPRPRPRFFAPYLPPTSAIATTDHSGLDNKSLVNPYARRRFFLIDVINPTARPRSAQPSPHPTRTADDDEERNSILPDSSSHPSSEKSAVDASDATIKPLRCSFCWFHTCPTTVNAQQGACLTFSREVGLRPDLSLKSIFHEHRVLPLPPRASPCSFDKSSWSPVGTALDASTLGS